MRRVAVAGAVALALGSLAAPGADAARFPRHRADGKLGDWVGKPTNIAGRTTTSRGEYIYTDWVYDDYGPDLDGNVNQPAFRAQLAPTRGDYRYPDDPKRYGYNAADLRELRVAVDKHRLHLLIALETMKVANAAVVQVALDGDASRKTSAKGGRWPDGSGITTRGPEHFVTTSGNAAHLRGPHGEKLKLRSVANTKQNAIEVDVPLKALGRLAKRPRIWVVTGLNDGKGRFKEQSSGAPAVFNAGFRHFEKYPKPGVDPARLDGGSWSDTRQASVLATGDISKFSGSFNVHRLQRHASNKPKPLPPGEYVRIFKSKKRYGEGIDLKGGNHGSTENIGGNPKPEFKSRYQPYALYLPKGYSSKRKNVFTLDGHSLDCSHLEYFTVSPNQERQLGDQRRSIMITPLARGSDTWYIDAGLIDTIEAWNDVRKHYKIDDDRTFITGYSMGGYMTYRLGFLMPDRFSKAAAYVGPPAYQIWYYPAPPLPGDRFTAIGNTNKNVENAWNLPYEINDGDADELVPISGVKHQVSTFNADGNAYVFYEHPGNDHLSFILVDDWAHTRDFLGTKPRVKNPVEVRYRRYPAMDEPKNGLRFDRAYWVSQIAVGGKQKDAENSGFVDAITYGRGGHLAKAVQEAPQPVSGPGSPGTRTEQRHVAGRRLTKSNRLDLKLQNVTSAAFDLRRVGLSLERKLRVHVVTDRDSDLILRGPYRRVTVVGATIHKTHGGVRVHVTKGTHDLTLYPD